MGSKYSAGADKVVADAIAQYERWQAAGRPVQPAQAVTLTPAEVAKMIDHTELKPEAGESSFKDLCAEAIEYSFASVCVGGVSKSVLT